MAELEARMEAEKQAKMAEVEKQRLAMEAEMEKLRNEVAAKQSDAEAQKEA